MEEKGEVIQVLSWLCVRHFMAITQDHCRLRAQPPFSNQTRDSSSSTFSHNTLIINIQICTPLSTRRSQWSSQWGLNLMQKALYEPLNSQYPSVIFNPGFYAHIFGIFASEHTSSGSRKIWPILPQYILSV